MTVLQLNQLTGISRQALYRILRTLEREGYVIQRPDDKRFVLTSLVKSLSDGFKDESLIAEVAPPELDRLQRKVIWPTEMAVCKNFSMHIAYSTRRHSPFVIDYGSVGVVLPILRTAMGISYISHCAPKERQEILRYFRAQKNSIDGALALKPAKLLRVLTTCRQQGYATRHRNIIAGDVYPDMIDTNATIAVPILSGGRATASIAITYIASAMTTNVALQRYLKDLQGAADTIAAKLNGSKK